ncbi:methyl-accepting chemotaxis protein [Peribacillus sp. NPDC097264]|uniref:methyl-accepting chemotaxis protein n=1 Tax=Peribacillus sp. NPDC097264 TaxID=3390616 RepID=UPI003CFC9472
MKLSIKNKLLLSFFLVSIIFGVSAFISYHSMKDMNKKYDYILDNISEVQSITQSIQTDAARQVTYLRGYLLYETPDMKEKMYESNENINELIKEARDLSHSDKMTKELDGIKASNDEWIEESRKSVEAVRANPEKAKALARDNVVPISTKMVEQTNSFYTWIKDDIMVQKVKEVQDKSKSATKKIIILSLIAFVLAMADGLLISSVISKPIEKLSKMANRVAEGDLNIEKIEVRTRDEIYVLNQSFEKMTQNLHHTITAISSNTNKVTSSAEQLSVSSEQSKLAAETIALSIQEISGASESSTRQLEISLGSLNEVSQGVERITESTASMSELSKETEKQAEEGSHYVEENLKQMRFIHESVNQSNQVIDSLSERSNQIGNIIDVITGIAGQTNLLALNAAIEAARAGEHGKGFAVVADEVKKLAEQSQNSTKLITDLIMGMQDDTRNSVTIMKDVMDNAEQGVKVSVETSNKFAQILQSTRDITPKIEEITASIQQISVSVDEVSETSNKLTAHAQENAANSEEVAASTEEQLASMEEINSSVHSLTSMADELKQVVRKFQI